MASDSMVTLPPEPEPELEALPGGGTIVRAGGLCSSRLVFSHVNGWFAQGTVGDPQTRAAWAIAGELAARTAREQAAAARQAAEAEHDEAVELVMKQVAAGEQELAEAEAKVPVLESQVERASAQGRPAGDLRRKLRDQRDLVKDITTFLGEVRERLKGAEKARADAGRAAFERSFKDQHLAAEAETRQAERAVLEALAPPAQRWHVLNHVREACREEIRKLTLGANIEHIKRGGSLP
jgi:hypothetical protein